MASYALLNQKKEQRTENRGKSLEGSASDNSKKSTAFESSSSNSDSRFPIIVHCHLRWEGVWQRPQQFLSRLSRCHPVLFVEGPILFEGDEPPRCQLRSVPEYPNVTVMHTEFPASRFHDGAWVDEQRYQLLKQALEGPLNGQFQNAVQWFYDPMAVPSFVGRMGERAVVYDCMDELAQFRFAPPEIIARERVLLQKADVVFTGGRRLRESKSKHNSNCHFYGCGVDVRHFSSARSESTVIPSDVKHLPKPVLGYFGVIDERLDYDLIAALADANPNWSVVMIGPVVKVDPAHLPQRPNLHWLGRREYSQLPGYTRLFDVCLMPFALNEATEYINPTKALEYMATGRPIVSSAVPDVVSNFGEVVKIAKDQNEFVELCCQQAAGADQDAVEKGLSMADSNQWETIIEKLEKHINDALRAKSYV